MLLLHLRSQGALWPRRSEPPVSLGYLSSAPSNTIDSGPLLTIFFNRQLISTPELAREFAGYLEKQ